MDQNPKKGGEVSKNGRTEAIQTGVLNFQRYHCLSASVCSVETWEKSGLLTLKTNLAPCCQKSSTQSIFFHTLFEAWVTTCSPNLDLGLTQKSLKLSGVFLNPLLFK